MVHFERFFIGAIVLIIMIIVTLIGYNMFTDDFTRRTTEYIIAGIVGSYLIGYIIENVEHKVK